MAFTSTIHVMTVLTSKPEVDQSMQPCLLKNSSKSYITPTPKDWRGAEKVKTNFDLYMYIFFYTITEGTVGLST